MNNSVSERIFYIESDEDEEKFIKQEDDAFQLSLSICRQSIDIVYTHQVFGFLGTPTLSRLGSSFLSSSFVRRHTPEVLPGLSKPLLPTAEDEQLPPKRRSSHTLFPPRKSLLRITEASFKGSQLVHEVPARQSFFGQAMMNGMNVLCGVGILSTPYAVKKGGWAGLSILFLFALLSFYTGVLLRYCGGMATTLIVARELGVRLSNIFVYVSSDRFVYVYSLVDQFGSLAWD